MRTRAAVCGCERRDRSRTRSRDPEVRPPAKREAAFLLPPRHIAKRAASSPRVSEASMWTSWLERTLGAHDAAEYAERRARRPEVEEVSESRATSPSPL